MALSAGTPDTGRELGKSNNSFNTRTYIQALVLSAGTPDTGRELGKSNDNFNRRTHIQALGAVCRYAGQR